MAEYPPATQAQLREMRRQMDLAKRRHEVVMAKLHGQKGWRTDPMTALILSPLYQGDLWKKA